MKVVQIGFYPQDENLIKGGVQASVYGLTQSLIKLSHKVVVITIPDKSVKKRTILEKENLSVYFFENEYKYQMLNILYFKKILSLIKKESPDVIHIHATTLLSLLLLSILKLRRKNVVITIHGIASVEFWKNFKKKKSITPFLKLLAYSPIEFLFVNLSSKIIVDTEYVSDVLEKITRRKITIIPQGIDSSFYDHPNRFVKNTILSIGVISPRKGYEYSIKAISQLKRTYPDINYHIIGIQNEKCKSYYEQLKSLIEKEDLNANVHFHTNLLFGDLRTYLEKAELFILHSLEESQGIVFCEAMAAKKPIVATNVGGIPYVVKDGENALLSPYGDINSFANNINIVLSDPVLRERMSKKSSELSKFYHWDAITKKIISLIYES